MAINQAEQSAKYFLDAWGILNRAFVNAESGSVERMEISGMMKMCSGLNCLASAIVDVNKKLETTNKGR